MVFRRGLLRVAVRLLRSWRFQHTPNLDTSRIPTASSSSSGAILPDLDRSVASLEVQELPLALSLAMGGIISAGAWTIAAAKDQEKREWLAKELCRILLEHPPDSYDAYLMWYRALMIQDTHLKVVELQQREPGNDRLERISSLKQAFNPDRHSHIIGMDAVLMELSFIVKLVVAILIDNGEV